MTHAMTLLAFQLAVIVIGARITGWLVARYCKLPKVLGELLAGMLIGPYTLGRMPFVLFEGPLFPLHAGPLPISPELYGFAVVASIVLLFCAGLETDLATFIKFSVKGSLAGIGGVTAAFFMGGFTAVLLLPDVDSILQPTALFLGTLCTATSVGISARILSEKKKLSGPEGVTILAAAVVDDVIGIILLAVVAGVARVAASGGTVPWGHIGLISAKAFGFWLTSTVLGILIAPFLSRQLKRLDSMTMVAAVSFGIALFVAGLSERAGLAMIIGAYVTGLSLSQTDIAHEILEKLRGLYDFMVPIFFAVMGMMVDFAMIPKVFLFGAAYVLVSFAAKFIGCGIPALLSGFNLRGALRIGSGMLPRGEVTLIIAGVGLSSGAIGPEMFGVAVMTLLAAGIAAPPIIDLCFKGGSGYRGKLDTRDEAQQTVKLEFPSSRMAEFVAGSILESFRNAGFFTHLIDSSRSIYGLRKDNIHITLKQDGVFVQLSTIVQHEMLMRLLVVEVLVELKEFVQSIEGMKSPDMMGAELMKDMFTAPNVSTYAS